jgi:hypothetical protein
MTQATRVHSTPRETASKINSPVDPTRRHLLTVAAGGAVAAAMSPAVLSAAPADPIFAAIEACRQADAACLAVDGDIPDEIGQRWSDAEKIVMRTRPTTPSGLAALTTWVREKADWLRANGSCLMTEDFCALTATIDDTARGMSGLKAWLPPLPVAMAGVHPDAQLIELGARFEPLVDLYYFAHRRWSASLAQAHAEHDREFGDPADRNYEYPPEIVAAFSDSCERSGAREADDTLSAIDQEMKQLANAINAASVNSIEGLRAKALVAFWEVAPLGAGDTEFHFEDAYPFQQLFTAVAEFCGLNGKMAATGYELPDIGLVEAAPDDDSDDDGEEA